MNTLVATVAVVAVLFLAARFGLRLIVRRIAAHPEFVRATSEYERKRAEEEATLEEAPWIGKTGLGEETERELPRYLRREFGEFLEDDGLKASDLVYLGAFTEAPGVVHYWRIPYKDQEPVFAYVEVDARDGSECTGWGGRSPADVPAVS